MLHVNNYLILSAVIILCCFKSNFLFSRVASLLLRLGSMSQLFFPEDIRLSWIFILERTG